MSEKENVFTNVAQVKPFWSRLAELELKPIDWLIKGWIPFDSFGALYGPPGCGKSYLALDIASTIASGLPSWHGHKTKGEPMPVFYLCGEGKQGLRLRLEAWKRRGGNSAPEVIDNLTENLYISASSAPLTDISEADRLLELIDKITDKPALMVIDTVARNFGGKDENNASDMEKLVKNCERMRNALSGMPVLAIHHTGLKDKDRMRGSSSLECATDFMLTVEKNADSLVPRVTRMKDGDHAPPLSLRFQSQDVGFDGEDLIYSSHLTQDPRPKTDDQGLGPAQVEIIGYLRKLKDKSLDRGLNGDVMMKDLQEKIRLSGGDNKRTKRTLESLADRGVIRINGDIITLRQ